MQDGGTGTPDASGTSDATADSAPTTQNVEIKFAAKVGSTPFSCAAMFSNLGAAGDTEVSPIDFRWFVHEVRLIRQDGVDVPVTLMVDGKWQSASVALLDFEDNSGSCNVGTPDMNDKVVGTVPAGTYTGLAFTVGVPFAENHQNQATAPSPLTILQWSWQGGYRFMKLDTKPKLADGGAGATFNFHLGSTGCDGSADGGTPVSACARPNRFEVRLPTFDVATNKVVLDYAALVSGSDLRTNGGGPPGCMSGLTDPECAPLFPKVGLDLTNGTPATSPQSIFKVE